MKIDHGLVKKLALLARLDVSDAEEEAFAGQLPAIVEYVGKLQAADLPVLPTEQISDTSQRADGVHQRSTPDTLLAQAPVRQDDFWKVDSVKG